ncbi:MAG: YcaO-like family protein, partial [Sulfitobacter sp.]
APYFAPKILTINEKTFPDMEHILRIENQLVDPVTGPIKSLTSLDFDSGLPAIKHAVAELADPGWHKSGMPILRCGGNELDARAARAAALGEAIERGCATQFDPAACVHARWDHMPQKAIRPKAFDLFDAASKSQPDFPYAPMADDTAQTWVWATALSTKKPVLVPASRVFVPYSPKIAEPPNDYPMISGFAAGASIEAAVLSAMLEVIERDSFMIARANQLPLQPVSLQGDKTLAAVKEVFARCDIEVRVGLITLDFGVPVAIAIARSGNRAHPATVISAAAAMSPQKACEKALTELTANWLNVHHSALTHAGAAPAGDPADLRDETAHGLFFAQHQTVPLLDVWWKTDTEALDLAGQQNAQIAPGQHVRDLVSAITAQELEVLIVDLTAPEIAALGLHTVKCLIPGTYPMNFDAVWPHFGGARMRHAPVRAGLRATPLSVDQLCKTPHPFP